MDVVSGRVIDHTEILVEGEFIKDRGAGPLATPPDCVVDIDLSQAWVMPGFIDCHTHITSQPENYYEDKFRENPPSISR